MQINKWPDPRTAPNQEQFLASYYIALGKAEMCKEIVDLIETSGSRIEMLNKQITNVKNPYQVGTSGEKKTSKSRKT